MNSNNSVLNINSNSCIGNNDKEKHSPDDCIIIYEQLLKDQISSKYKCLRPIENNKKIDDFYGIPMETSTKNMSGLTNFIKSQTLKCTTPKRSNELDEDSDSHSDILDIFPSPSHFYKEICSEFSNDDSYLDSFSFKKKLSEYRSEDKNKDSNFDYLNLNTDTSDGTENKENLFLYKCNNDKSVDTIEDLELSDFIMNMSVNDVDEVKSEGQNKNFNLTVTPQRINSSAHQHSSSPSQRNIKLIQTSTPRSNFCKPLSGNTEKNLKESVIPHSTRLKDERLHENIIKTTNQSDLQKIAEDNFQAISDTSIKSKKISENKEFMTCSKNSSRLEVISEAEVCSILDGGTNCLTNKDLLKMHTEKQSNQTKAVSSSRPMHVDDVSTDISVSKKVSSIRTKLEFNNKKLVENTICQENEIKAYKKPFKSDNEFENQDINNPNWDIYRKLKTDEERYYIVRKHWRSIVVPDPNENLTFHSYRRRQNAKNGGKCINPKTRFSRKRSRENDDEQMPANKRARLFTDVNFNSRAIDQTLKTLEQNFRNELIVPRNVDTAHKLEMAYREYCMQLQNARHEAEMVHKFYTGLPDQKIITQKEIETEQWDIEEVYRLFRRYYNWSGKVFNPVIKKY